MTLIANVEKLVRRRGAVRRGQVLLFSIPTPAKGKI